MTKEFTETSIEEAKKEYDNGNTVFFVDERDLDPDGKHQIDKIGVPINNKNAKSFDMEVGAWYMFNHWGGTSPRLKVYT